MANQQSKCMAKNGSVIKKYKANLLKVGVAPQAANIIAFTMTAIQCGGKSELCAYEALKAKHKGAKWYTPKATFEAITGHTKPKNQSC